jgi:hypothetical protein
MAGPCVTKDCNTPVNRTRSHQGQTPVGLDESDLDHTLRAKMCLCRSPPGYKNVSSRLWWLLSEVPFPESLMLNLALKFVMAASFST